jgi:biotin carboxyl carrier protein
MNYLVGEKQGERSVVGLQEIGEGLYELTFEGVSVRVDAVKSGPTVYSLIEEGRQWEASVDEKGPHGFDVLVRGALFHLEAEDERSGRLAQSVKASASGPQRVEAEMPGKVIKVEVAVGYEVTEGQGVVILEAMKMENEIPSPIDGTVTEVSVAEGDTVESGAPLFTVEPPPESAA